MEVVDIFLKILCTALLLVVASMTPPLETTELKLAFAGGGSIIALFACVEFYIINKFLNKK